MGYDFGLLRNRNRTQTEILQNIEQLMAQQVGADQVEIEEKADEQLRSGTSGTRLMDASRYVIEESGNLDNATDQDTIELQPGEEKPIVRHDSGSAVGLLALGATDETDVSYILRANNQQMQVGGQTQSPLGTVNDPFSFPSRIGAAIPVQNFEYTALYDSNASGTVEVAGRAHLEVLG